MTHDNAPNTHFGASKTLSDGRRALVLNSIIECVSILRMVDRLDGVFNGDVTSKFEEERQKAYNDFLDNHPDREPGVVYSSQLLEFEKKYPSDILKKGELLSIKSYLRALTVVIFCQIFHSGYGDNNLTLKNDKQKNLIELNNILKEKMSPEHADNFNNIVEHCLSLRDKFIAHADADAYGYKIVNQKVASYRLMSSAVDAINFTSLQLYLETIWANFELRYA